MTIHIVVMFLVLRTATLNITKLREKRIEINIELNEQESKID